MSATVLTGDALLKRMSAAEASHEKRSQEVRVLQEVVKGDLLRLSKMIDISVVCGSKVDSESCARLPKAKLEEVLRSFVKMILEGIPHADDVPEEQRYETPCWCIGGLGSRWIDLDAKSFGLDFVRAAFYSKAEVEGKTKKPYLIQIMCEKAA
jgi:hypothetical protein